MRPALVSTRGTRGCSVSERSSVAPASPASPPAANPAASSSRARSSPRIAAKHEAAKQAARAVAAAVRQRVWAEARAEDGAKYYYSLAQPGMTAWELPSRAILQSGRAPG